VHGLVVDEQAGHGGVALAVDLLHLLDVGTGVEVDPLEVEPLQPQCGVGGHAGVRGR